MSYYRARDPIGRYVRATLQNTFGLGIIWCPRPCCGLGNPWQMGREPTPQSCHACGEVFLQQPYSTGEQQCWSPTGELETGDRER